MSPDDKPSSPSSPGNQPVSAPSRTPARSKRRIPAATLDYGSAMSRLDVLLLDADPSRSEAMREALTSRGRSVVVVKAADEAERVCEGMRPVVLLASVAGLPAAELHKLETVVRSPGGDKIALVAYVCGDEAASLPEGGPPLLKGTTPEALVEELAGRWPGPAR